MKTIRTRNDIFAAINCRIVEIEENRHGPDEEIIDCLITAGAYLIRAIESIIKHHKGPAPGKSGSASILGKVDK